MPAPKIRNLETISSQNPRLGETLKDVVTSLTNISDGTTVHPTGQQVAAPPNVAGMQVTGQNGIVHISLTDGSAAISRGINYHVEVSPSKSFSSQVLHLDLGASRSHRFSPGAGKLYYRATSQYPGSPASTPYVHPVAIDAGGAQGPDFHASTGAGTAACVNPQTGQGAGASPTRTGPNGQAPGF